MSHDFALRKNLNIIKCYEKGQSQIEKMILIKIGVRLTVIEC